jgi:hypothetical protein
MQLIRQSCCGASWVGAERAHCCRRTDGCGAVFDDVELWDAHRGAGSCLDPRTLDMVRTSDGVWLRALTHPDAPTGRRQKAPAANHEPERPLIAPAQAMLPLPGLEIGVAAKR